MKIAIDGTSGSGKSSIAKNLASKLGFNYFNVGQVYRALTTYFLEIGLNPDDEITYNQVLKNLDLRVEIEDNNQVVYVNDIERTKNLTTIETSEKTPHYAKFEPLRELVRQCQRSFADKYDVVMEGRDIGTEVLPDAEHKFFINADYKTRLGRRMNQLKKDMTFTKDEEDVLNRMFLRDKEDIERKTSPLTIDPSITYFDTTDQTLEQSIDKLIKKIKG